MRYVSKSETIVFDYFRWDEESFFWKEMELGVTTSFFSSFEKVQHSTLFAILLQIEFPPETVAVH